MPTKYGDIDYTSFYKNIGFASFVAEPILTDVWIDKKSGEVYAIFNHNDKNKKLLDPDKLSRDEIEVILKWNSQEPRNIPNKAYQKFIKALANFRRNPRTFKKLFNGPKFDRIVFSGPCTILTGDHNDKTVVRCGGTEAWDAEKAVLAALFIREYGKPQFNFLMDYIHEVEDEQVKKEERRIERNLDTFLNHLSDVPKGDANNESSGD